MIEIYAVICDKNNKDVHSQYRHILIKGNNCYLWVPTGYLVTPETMKVYKNIYRRTSIELDFAVFDYEDGDLESGL